ncbi:MAG: nucleoside-diphosphate-sugar epimerase [Planctomycetota bacterium]
MIAVVTGGGGFLGSAIVHALLARGDQVTSVSRSAYPQLVKAGAKTVQADLSLSGASIAEAFRGADVVFHCAAKAGIWGSAASFEKANVLATSNVLSACLAAGVRRLVLTSSPSVCFDGKDHVRAGNDLPLATSFLAHYPRTKADAERLALAAHGTDISVCALRPHLIYGPGDPHLVPRLLERARAGKLRIVGAGENEVSLTHVQNAAHAHLAAADALAPDAACGGQAYFVSDAQPVRLWDWVNTLLQKQGLAPVTRRVPFRVAYAAGACMELLWHALRRKDEPPMTRFVAAQLATSHSYDMGPASRDFGYEPMLPVDLPS